jgi:hypothetical protein
MCINQWMLSLSEENRATVAPHSAWLSLGICEQRCARESARGWSGRGICFVVLSVQQLSNHNGARAFLPARRVGAKGW